MDRGGQIIRKAVEDAGYAVVGVGVLAFQQFQIHKKTIRSSVESVARSVHLDRVTTPVCAVVSGGKAFFDAALRRDGDR